MISEFKEFVAKGNVMDLAVGVIIGGAFGKIVSSLVDDVIMPPIGLLLGGVKFDDLKIVMQQAAGEETPEVAIRYGSFMGQVINFIIIAFVIFMLVKFVNNMRSRMEKPKAEEEAAPAGPTQEELLAEIRDLLKSKS